MGLYDGSIASLQASSRTITVGESVGASFLVPHVSFVNEIVSKTGLNIAPYDRGKKPKTRHRMNETLPSFVVRSLFPE